MPGMNEAAPTEMSSAAPMASPESHNAAFAGGYAGSMPGGVNGSGGTHVATSMPAPVNTTPAAQASPTFTPSSVLELPNVIRSVNGMSDQTFQKSLPQQAMMRDMAMPEDRPQAPQE